MPATRTSGRRSPSARVSGVTPSAALRRALLADIYNWFTEGFGTVDLNETKEVESSSQQN
jgi:hypothetical protein